MVLKAINIKSGMKQTPMTEEGNGKWVWGTIPSQNNVKVSPDRWYLTHEGAGHYLNTIVPEIYTSNRRLPVETSSISPVKWVDKISFLEMHLIQIKSNAFFFPSFLWYHVEQPKLNWRSTLFGINAEHTGLMILIPQTATLHTLHVREIAQDIISLLPPW